MTGVVKRSIVPFVDITPVTGSTGNTDDVDAYEMIPNEPRSVSYAVTVSTGVPGGARSTTWPIQVCWRNTGERALTGERSTTTVANP